MDGGGVEVILYVIWSRFNIRHDEKIVSLSFYIHFLGGGGCAKRQLFGHCWTK